MEHERVRHWKEEEEVEMSSHRRKALQEQTRNQKQPLEKPRKIQETRKRRTNQDVERTGTRSWTKDRCNKPTETRWAGSRQRLYKIKQDKPEFKSIHKTWAHKATSPGETRNPQITKTRSITIRSHAPRSFSKAAILRWPSKTYCCCMVFYWC